LILTNNYLFGIEMQTQEQQAIARMNLSVPVGRNYNGLGPQSNGDAAAELWKRLKNSRHHT
jgi:hypothetical protein